LRRSNSNNQIIVSTREQRRQILNGIEQEIMRRNQRQASNIIPPTVTMALDAAQMQVFVDALIAAASGTTLAANRAAVQDAPPAPAAAPFALLPGSSNTNPLDCAKAESMKLFNKAVSPIDNKFSLNEDTLRTCIEQVR
jgi:hypothetical protein